MSNTAFSPCTLPCLWPCLVAPQVCVCLEFSWDMCKTSIPCVLYPLLSMWLCAGQRAVYVPCLRPPRPQGWSPSILLQPVFVLLYFLALKTESTWCCVFRCCMTKPTSSTTVKTFIICMTESLCYMGYFHSLPYTEPPVKQQLTSWRGDNCIRQFSSEAQLELYSYVAIRMCVCTSARVCVRLVNGPGSVFFFSNESPLPLHISTGCQTM